VCIFAYGQTGSGKTFTMEGPGDDRGVNFRALSELFRIKAARKDYTYRIQVSMKEVYNEKIRDLLASKDDGETDYKIRTGENGTFVEGLTQVEVNCEEDVLQLMKRGNTNRSTGATNMNEHVCAVRCAVPCRCPLPHSSVRVWYVACSLRVRTLCCPSKCRVRTKLPVSAISVCPLPTSPLSASAAHTPFAFCGADL
jgi:hypothetical protein